MASFVFLPLGTALLIAFGTTVSAFTIIRTGNEYMDQLLDTTAEKELGSLGRVPLPGFETNNRDRFLFVNVKVKTTYSNGYLRNVDEATRLGDCIPESDPRITRLSCTVQFDNLRIEYSGRMKYGQLPKISITAKATVRPVEAHLVITNNTAVPGNLRLQTFNLVSPVEIDPAFTGMGLLNRYLKMLKDPFVDNVGHHVQYAIERGFATALNRTLTDENQLKLKS